MKRIISIALISTMLLVSLSACGIWTEVEPTESTQITSKDTE